MNAKKYYESKEWGNPDWDRATASQFDKSEMFDFAKHYASHKLSQFKKVVEGRLIAYIKENKIIIQKADYIEDGWYIEIEGSIITLFEIPTGGGEESVIGCYDTILEAVNAGKLLT